MASKWDDVERWMEGQRLPKGFEVLQEPNWVEQYVRKMMTKSFPEASGLLNHSGLATFSETRQFLQVKINLPEGYERDRLRLFVREDRLRLDGLPNGKSETIKLPKLVKPKISKTLIRDSKLIVKLQKRPLNRAYHEAVIRW